jgi:signal peptidase I
MTKFFKIAIRTFLILMVVYLILIVITRSVFIVSPMRSDSMRPLIASNDIVVATKWFHTASLRTGDLVVVEIYTPAGDLTVRKIEQQPDTPTGQFYLRAVNTNGVDSKWLGALPARNIKGKVIWIIKQN